MVIFSHFDQVTIPSESNRLTDSTFLSCGVVPPDANFVTRWITPNGGILTSSNTNNNSRLSVLEGSFELNQRNIDGTALILRNLSYQDAGMYRCEARDQSILDSPWVQAVLKLELLGTYSSCYL